MQNERNRPETYLTPDDVAAAWNVSAFTVRKLCREGRLAGSFRVGVIWRIPASGKLEYERLHRGARSAAA